MQYAIRKNNSVFIKLQINIDDLLTRIFPSFGRPYNNPLEYHDSWRGLTSATQNIYIFFNKILNLNTNFSQDLRCEIISQPKIVKKFEPNCSLCWVAAGIIEVRETFCLIKAAAHWSKLGQYVF